MYIYILCIIYYIVYIFWGWIYVIFVVLFEGFLKCKSICLGIVLGRKIKFLGKDIEIGKVNLMVRVVL